jgi:hypothetical protein
MKLLRTAIVAILATTFLPGCLFALLGGGGGKTVVDRSKLSEVQSLAVVGVCGGSEMGVRRGGAMARIRTPHTNHLSGFDGAIVEVLAGRAVSSLADARQREGFETGHPVQHTTCLYGASPLMARGSGAPRPDVHLMSRMADTLDVDAVMTVVIYPGAAFKRRRVEISSAKVNPSHVFVVTRNGETILDSRIRAEITAPAADEPAAFNAFGEEIARHVAGYFSRR